MIAADDPRHGTLPGYSAGCRKACCRRARMRHQKKRRMDAAKGIKYTIDATGTRRRIQALMRLGWRARDIANLAGWKSDRAVQLLCTHRPCVNHKTANRIAAAYDQLCMTLGPSDITRARAERAGWPPPLAWNDGEIDDPNATPVGLGTTATDRADVMADVDSWGGNATEAARALAIERDALQTWAQRHGCSELYRRLAAREALRGNQWTEGAA